MFRSATFSAGFRSSFALKKLTMPTAIPKRFLAATTPMAPPRSNGGPLYREQLSLPKLQIPKLDETMKKYLKSVKPLVSSDQFKNTLRNVEEFSKSGGQGEILHQRLLQRNNELNQGWFIDWWNDYAYFGYRAPLPVNVSYFFLFRDDKKRTKQAARAASIITGALEYRKKLISQTLEPEKMKGKALCHFTYQFLYHTCRYPRKPSDYTLFYDAMEHNHIAVMRKNLVYIIKCADATGRQLSTEEFEIQLDRVIKDAGEKPHDGVGIFTSADRDSWTDNRNMLILDRQNADNLKLIETSAFVMCLDDTAPVTREQASHACWVGDGKNRFYDKSCNFFVFENGKAGFLGEHSMMDATPTHRMCEYILYGLDKNHIDHGKSGSQFALEPPKRLDFHFNDALKQAMCRAEINFRTMVDAQELKVLAYEGYGKDLIKRFKLGPDAYAQMAIQLAYYKCFGTFRATYESSTTRGFAYGRTEVTRSVSEDSVAWVKAMQDPYIPIAQKEQLGRKAVDSHSTYMGEAVEGKGIDRHLLGMKLSLKSGEPLPALYSDPSFSMTSHWAISTSQISSEYYDGWGWGEVVPDGFGIAYMVNNHSLHFNIVSLKLCGDRLRHYLAESLRDMKEVFSSSLPKHPKDNSTKAKL